MQKNNLKKIKLMAGASVLSLSMLINSTGFAISTKDAKEVCPTKISKIDMTRSIASIQNNGMLNKNNDFLANDYIMSFSDFLATMSKFLYNPQLAEVHYPEKEENLETEQTTLSTTSETKEEPTIEEKIATIMEVEKLSPEQWREFACICIAESKPGEGAYQETANVVTTMINRKISRTWVDYINRVRGGNAGNNLYGHATVPGQYVAFGGQGFLTLMALSDEELYQMPNFQAVVDTLYDFDTIENYVPIHNYVGFRANGTDPTGKVQLVPQGNLYCYPIDDYIPVEERETCVYNNGLGRY